ncbi:MAG TPA: DEAD/DEAH box helicase, partial [Verrucomicrobiae bacterium]|nr:DEAD/DEAH box helicase [Verrucomicrobiae bacterium]
MQVKMDPLLNSWLERIATTLEMAPIETPPEENREEQLRYVLKPEHGRIRLELAHVRALKAGGFGQPRNCTLSSLLNPYRTAAVADADVELARKIVLAQKQFNTYEAFLEGEQGARLLPLLLATGRCHWRGCGKQRPPLTPGEPRKATAEWEVDNRGSQKPVFKSEPPVTAILPVSPLWYVDEDADECGPLETGMPPAIATAWLSAPVVRPELAEAVALRLAGHQDRIQLPPLRNVAIEAIERVRPTARLLLYAAQLKKHFYGYGWNREKPLEVVHLAHLDFDYAGVQVEPRAEAMVLERFEDGHLRRMRRDNAFERKAFTRLVDSGLTPATTLLFDYDLGEYANALACRHEDEWLMFVHHDVPELRRQGWDIEVHESFQLRIVEPESWYTDAEAESGGNDWFGVELGIVVDEQKVNLLPILLELFRKNPTAMKPDQLALLPDDALIPVPLPDGGNVMLTAARTRQMLSALLELMNPDALNKNGQLRLPKLRALEFADDADWRWMGASELRDFAKRLRGFSGIRAVAVPEKLNATLRPYQAEGLSWLQFLREYDLAGILADDMGLGKTVQALAHLLIEQASGRLDRPALVIAPTSLMTNWRQEAERFAPSLKVLVLHGLDRKKDFERIAEHDLIVTSYPLLPRDH